VVRRGRCGGGRWLASVHGVGSVMGSCFSDNACIFVGNGVSTLFWLDRWCGDVPLRDRFFRLYDLSENKLSIVAPMSTRVEVREGRLGSREGDYGRGRRKW